MIDLRSDTVTMPTTAMLDAMRQAEVGDDILREDISVQELEALGAKITGKEAGLFTVSGTMSNQLAVMTFTQRGEEILVGEESHIYNLEVGGLAALSQVQVCAISCPEGKIPLQTLQKRIRPKGVQSPRTALLCFENTYNLNRGYAVSAKELERAAELARQRDIPVYLDGARIFNAAAKLHTTVQELCAPADAVQFCLTKGLAAPFGALLTGTADFIEKARWMKQRVGGGFRQAGYMAAAGVVALQTMQAQVAEDNRKAQWLATALQEIDPSFVTGDVTRMTNIVLLDLNQCGISEERFLFGLQENKIKVKILGEKQYRLVCHKDVTEEQLRYVRNVIAQIVKSNNGN